MIPGWGNNYEMWRIAQNKFLYDALFEQLIVKNPSTLQDYINQGAAVPGFDIRELLHKISQPTLIIHGTVDKLIPVKQIKILNEKIPNSRLKLLEGSGQAFMIEQSEKVNGSIWNFKLSHLDKIF